MHVGRAAFVKTKLLYLPDVDVGLSTGEQDFEALLQIFLYPFYRSSVSGVNQSVLRV